MASPRRAVVVETTGPYAQVMRLTQLPSIQEVPTGCLHVRVRCTGLSFPDLLQVEGKYQEKADPPFVPGISMVGEVLATGSGVSDWAVGDRVVGTAAPGVDGHLRGGLADEALMSADSALRVPDFINDDIILTMHENYWWVHHGVHTCGKVSAGDTLLVLGASGACGMAAIDLGKAFGATVVACASSSEKLEACRAAGADVAIDYGTSQAPEKFMASLRAAGLYGRITAVFDPVGGRYAEAAFRAMAPKGRYVVFGFAAGGTDPKSAFPNFPINLLLMKGQHLIGCYGESHAEHISEMFKMVQEGRLKPLASRSSRYALEEFADAFRDIAARKAIGKVIVSVGTPHSSRL